VTQEATQLLDEVSRRQALIERAKAREHVEQQKIEERCMRDPMYWLRNQTMTYDEHAKRKGVAVYKPFPTFPAERDFMQMLMGYMMNCSRLAVPKSREMMTSWLALGYATWKCQYEARTRVVIQTQKDIKAEELVGYAKTLYENQPEWLRKLHPLKHNSQQSKSRLIWANESQVQGVPSGADQVRAYHPTVLILDEASFLPEAQASYETANPVCSQIIMVSSAAPGWFGDMCAL
jgi:hypothetical protein